jgi:SecD/SecF fusion protein
MQLKGLVKFFTIALILISLFQLSFTAIVNNYEKKISSKVTKQMPNATKVEKDIAIKQTLDSLSDQVIFNAGFKKYTYQNAKEQQLNLGLDLQGGMNVVLEVGTSDLVKNLSNNPINPILVNAINRATALKKASQDNFITLFVRAFTEQNPNGRLADLFVKTGQTEITVNSSNSDVERSLRASAKKAVKNTFNVINNRIDKFGVAQPNINLDENKDIITVELAGTQNPEKVRKILQANAKLEFFETYTTFDLVKSWEPAEKSLIEYLANTSAGRASLDSGKTITAAKDTVKKSGKLGSLDTASLGGTASNLLNDTASLSKDEKIAKDRKEHPLFSLFQPENPQNDPKTGKPLQSARVGYLATKDTAKFREYMTLPSVKGNFPSNCKFLFGKVPDSKEILFVYAMKLKNAEGKPELTGEYITRADQDFDPMSNEVLVRMNMNSTGAQKWGTITGNNIGRPVAVALDDIVYTAPTINDKIPGGSSSISGSFKVEEAQDLAKILESGKLDAPAQIVQEQVVGPTEGKENIAKGKNSFIIAFLVIFLLMIVYFNTAGIVADIALILNLLFTIGILSAWGGTLTMASIAGLVLTIGMAVDTNVIIFERIKEELASGKSHAEAIKEGYKRSLAPVLDGHLTVFLTAFILFIFGLGPVLGFATTQMLGIALSLFCGILVSRLLTEMYMKSGKHLEYFTGLSKSIFKKAHFKFIEARKYAYMISIVVLILGVGSLFNGFDYGVEFKGGRSYTIQLNKETKTAELANSLKTVFEKAPTVKTIGTNNQVNITTDYLIDNNNQATEGIVSQKMYDGLKALNLLPANATIDNYKSTSQTVQPTISDDLKKGSIKATWVSILLIFIYIFIRFRKWQYSVGTLVALLHDVLVTLAVFSFLRHVVPFSLEINQHFIAAMLTVIGFSMNDTVIVFDRIREYFSKRPGADKKTVINEAINDTLSRTIMTSLTVFITLLILFIFGGEATRGFSFAMLIGVITGTYSSIFVAAPILVDLDKTNTLGQEVDKAAKIKALKAEA